MNDIIELSKKLIKIESTADNVPNIKKVLKVARDFLNTKDIVIRDYSANNKPSFVATMKDTMSPHIILNGHLDVVPGNVTQFTPKESGDKLIGRGAQDMKSSCAVMLSVFKKLSQDNKIPRDSLGLMIVTDEEVGGFDGTKVLLEKGYRPSFFLAGESTDFGLEIMAKGVLQLEVEVMGAPAHAAYLWEGKNAIFDTVQVLSSLNKEFPIPKKFIWKTTMNLSTIVGGDATNRVPESCKFKLDIRYVPGDDPDRIIDIVKLHLSKDASVKVLEKEPALEADPKNPYIKSLRSTAKSELGYLPKLVKKCGASDARFYSDAGIAVTNFGPIGGGLHSDNEWVSIKSLKQQASILEKWIMSLK